MSNNMSLTYIDFPKTIDTAILKTYDKEKQLKINLTEIPTVEDYEKKIKYFQLIIVSDDFGVENETIIKLDFETTKDFLQVANILAKQMITEE